MDKEKMVQIYEAVADITLSNLSNIKKPGKIIHDATIDMIYTTLQLYNAIEGNQPAELFKD